MSDKIRNVVAKYSPPLTSEQVANIVIEVEKTLSEQLSTSAQPEQKVETKKKGR